MSLQKFQEIVERLFVLPTVKNHVFDYSPLWTLSTVFNMITFYRENIL
jgi:hypothetical protein